MVNPVKILTTIDISTTAKFKYTVLTTLANRFDNKPSTHCKLVDETLGYGLNNSVIKSTLPRYKGSAHKLFLELRFNTKCINRVVSSYLLSLLLDVKVRVINDILIEYGYPFNENENDVTVDMRTISILLQKINSSLKLFDTFNFDGKFKEREEFMLGVCTNILMWEKRETTTWNTKTKAIRWND